MNYLATFKQDMLSHAELYSHVHHKAATRLRAMLSGC